MKTKHIHTRIDKDDHRITVWLHPSIDIDEFEKKIHAVDQLFEACDSAKQLIELCMDEVKVSEDIWDKTINELIKAIKKATD